TRPATALAMVAVAAGFVLTWLGESGSTLALGLLVAAAIVLDFGMAANLVLGQRAIFTLGAELRGRLNGLYMATFFVGGAIGSALGGWAYAHGGWALASMIGIAFPIAALLYYATEKR
ncbi:MAG TPA: MFS transporter, partial [Tardiphaga sp.]